MLVTHDYFIAMRPKAKARFAKAKLADSKEDLYWNAIKHYIDLGINKEGDYPRFYLDPGGAPTIMLSFTFLYSHVLL